MGQGEPTLARITSKITSIEQTKGVSEIAAELNDLDVTDAIDLTERVEKPAPRPMPTESRPRDHRPRNMPTPQNFGWVRAFAIIAVLIWLVLASILCFSVLGISKNYGGYSALQWAGIIGMLLGPILLIWVTAYSLKQLARLSTQAHMLACVTDNLTQPDETVIRKSKILSAAITKQVDEVDDKLNAALGRLATMEDVLNTQTASLAQSNIDATQTADYISTNLQAQNTALDKISGTFDERMMALSQMITGHTEKLAKATQMAEQKIKEARISVEGATSKINSASDIVRSNTVQAASTLSASHADISSLGNIIKERSVELDNVYKKHANDLTGMIEHLRDEQQNLGAVLEERLTKMRDLSLSAQASAESLIKASAAGKDTVEALAQSATLADTAVKARFAEMKDMVRYSNEHARTISDKAAQRVKDSLELTRKEIGRIEDEMGDLQNRISSANLKSLELVPEAEEASPRETGKRKRTRLKLKPVRESIHLTPMPPTQAAAEENTPTEPETSPEIIETEISKNDALDLYIEPNIDPHIETKKYEIPAPEIATPHVEPSDTKTVQRMAPRDLELESKQGFSLRSLFGGRNSKPDASLSIASAAPLQPTQMPTPLADMHTAQTATTSPENGSDILQALGELGLAPNAVVDDGCIIEAANSRVSAGHEAMSRVVAKRLDGPVLHLSKAMSLDANLSQNAIGFAGRFDQTVEALSGNREAIRTCLEDEQGRAYLLCDAALNYGRV